jgi:hypothetical protein
MGYLAALHALGVGRQSQNAWGRVVPDVTWPESAAGLCFTWAGGSKPPDGRPPESVQWRGGQAGAANPRQLGRPEAEEASSTARGELGLKGQHLVML